MELYLKNSNSSIVQTYNSTDNSYFKTYINIKNNINKETQYTIFNSQFLLIANLLLLITFTIKNKILFRLFLISAIMFLIMYNLSFPTVFIDVIITNIAMLLININSIIRLFLNIKPPYLTNEESYVYREIFNSELNKHQFKKLMKYVKRRVYRVSSPIAVSGNSFLSIYLLVHVPKDVKVKLRLKNTFIADISEKSWLGIVEYVELLNLGSFKETIQNGRTNLWCIDVAIQYKSATSKQEESNKKIDSNYYQDTLMNFNKDCDKNSISVKNNNILYIDNSIDYLNEEYISDIEGDIIKNREEVIVYEWSLSDLCKLYNDPEEGINLKNSLHSLWLVSLSNYLKTKFTGLRNDLSNNNTVNLNKIKNRKVYNTADIFRNQSKKKVNATTYKHKKSI